MSNSLGSTLNHLLGALVAWSFERSTNIAFSPSAYGSGLLPNERLAGPDFECPAIDIGTTGHGQGTGTNTIIGGCGTKVPTASGGVDMLSVLVV